MILEPGKYGGLRWENGVLELDHTVPISEGSKEFFECIRDLLLDWLAREVAQAVAGAAAGGTIESGEFVDAV